MSSYPNDLLGAALNYRRRGWSIIPLHWRNADGSCSCQNSQCPKPGKHPLIKWEEFQTRLATEEEARPWWTQWPHANIGIICGQVSGGLVVLDIDNVELAEELIRKRGIELVATLVRTPRKGLHIYFQESKEQSRSGPLIPGVADLKAEGGYVIAPPSSGYGYISEAKPLAVNDALAKAWDILGTAGLSRPISKVQADLSQGDGMIEEGTRNTALTSIAGSLRRKGIDSETIRTALEVVNERRCEPPLSDQEVLTIAKSIGKYAPDPNLTSVSKDPELARIESWTPRPITELAEGSTIEWEWEGYIPRGGVSLLTGLWKSGKTTLLCHLLKAKCSGGVLAELSVASGKVLVISEESDSLWRRRRDDFAMGNHIHIITRPFKGKPSLKEWERFIHHISNLIQKEGYSLVVVDSVATHWPVADENDAGQVTQALALLYHWTGLGASVLLIHHPKKGDASEGQASRGSGALPAFVDIVIEFRRYAREERENRRRVLTTYSRYEESPPELVLELAAEGYVVVGTKGEATRADRHKVILAELLSKPPGSTAKEVRENWCTDGVPKPGLRTLEGDLNFLLKEGQIKREGEGKKGSPYRFWKDDSIPAGSSSYTARNESGV